MNRNPGRSGGACRANLHTGEDSSQGHHRRRCGAQARKDKPEPQASLFADFNGIAFEELVDFYRHEQNWTNRLILGDSLLVMTSPGREGGIEGPGADDLY